MAMPMDMTLDIVPLLQLHKSHNHPLLKIQHLMEVSQMTL